jgi:hypothetical protein
MKKLVGLMVILLVSTGLYAAGVNEQKIDAEYAAKTYSDRSDWVYEFNQTADKVHTYGMDIQKNDSLKSFNISQFDEYSYRYKALLDVGVKYQYIDDETRKRQITKLREERDTVSAALSQSSGLGL